MPLDGHIYWINDAKQAFTPVILGNMPPKSGFQPWPGTKVLVTYHLDPFGFIILSSAVATVGSDGSFHLPDPPFPQGWIHWVSLKVSAGVVVYRSGVTYLSEIESKELNIWIYADKLPTSDGITAGTVSQQLQGSGLPGNTKITSGGPYGLNFVGSSGQVNIDFNIMVTPDTSQDLNNFLDLSLNGWDISVGWPTDWCESADDVLNSIKSGVVSAGKSIQSAVLKRIEGVLEDEEGLPAALASKFLQEEVSVTFYGVGYPNHHTWKIGDTKDDTIVITANPCIGYPRNLLAEGAKPTLIIPKWGIGAFRDITHYPYVP